MKVMKQGLHYTFKFKFIRFLSFWIFNFFLAAFVPADINGLFFGEAQAVAGFSNQSDSVLWYSYMQEDFMQKSSLGIDTVWRFSNETGDWLSLSFQGRIAYDNTSTAFIQPQLYNAFVKLKLPAGDFWLGHNRIAAGLFSYYDTHGLLLPDSSMFGYGVERDWGLGWQTIFDTFEISASASLGSQAGFLFSGNFLGAARLGIGDRNQDNWTLGWSLLGGNVPESHGWYIMEELHPLVLAGLDWNWFIDNWEFAFDSFFGLKDSNPAGLALFRIGWDLFGDKMLKIELQPVAQIEDTAARYFGFAGISSQLTESFALRALVGYAYPQSIWQCSIQFYYYALLF